MTQADYEAYQERVAFYLLGLQWVSTGHNEECAQCADSAPGEQWFSWSLCEICARPFGGMREPWHAIGADGALVHGSCCTDCVYYLEYGRLDDTTMEGLKP